MSAILKLFGVSTQPVEIPPDLVTRDEKRDYIRAVIDLHGFRWLVWEVSASGFFTDSYNLFATNVILPTLAFIYWPDETSGNNETLINCLTLGGSCVGQLLFGYLADKVGRTKLYGVELVIVVVTTMGMCASSQGFLGSISIVSWIAAMRFIMGVGIGAEYPISAALCTEWASTQARARMMSAVFLMQPLGQLVSQLVGLFVLLGYDRSTNHSLQSCRDATQCGSIDGVWRWVTGVGAIPAVVALYYRFRIKDPGLYDLDVRNKADRALQSTLEVYPNISTTVAVGHGGEAHANGGVAAAVNGGGVVHEVPPYEEEPLPEQFTRADIHEYFIAQGNWRPLAATSLCWFLLDVAFYGLGMGSPRTLSKLWTYIPPQTGANANATGAFSQAVNGSLPFWNPNLPMENPSIYDALYANAKQNLITVCIGSVTGSVLLIALIDYVPRKQFQALSFLTLAALLFVTGISFFSVFQTDNHAVSIVLVALCNFAFNFGANTLTFIIPAELFPTRYRATCHGIAAASGKLGSVVVQAVLPSMAFGGSLVSDPNSRSLGWVFVLFGFVMALGALFASVWIPALQDTRGGEGGLRLPNRTLEVLAEGVVRAEDEGQVIGLRNNFVQLVDAIRDNLPEFRWLGRGSGGGGEGGGGGGADGHNIQLQGMTPS